MMPIFLRGPLIGLAAAALASATFGDEPEAVHHCRGGVPFESASTTAPPLMSGIGSSQFPITTSSEKAQAYFDQGVNMLHAFWDFEAYRAFREASRLDPEAAMPHWGIFTSLGYNSREMSAERTASLERAVALSAHASDREQYYIRAASLLVEPGKGRDAFIAEMEALIDRYPEDIDAKLFLANTLSTPTGSYAPDGRPRSGKLYGQAILRNLLVTHPEHAAVHHYWIHAVENGPRPEEALASAEKLPQLAPGAGHLVHMPGHIYYRLGRYREAREAFLASMAVDLEYMNTHKVTHIANWNYVHNLDYLVGNCAEDGRLEEGERWARLLSDLAVGEERLENRGAGYAIFGGLASLPRLQMRYGKWQEAIESLTRTLSSRTESVSLSRPYLEGLLEFLRGIEAAERRDVDAARTHAASLSAIAANLAASKPALGADWYAGHAGRILAVHALELEGVVRSLEGKLDESVALLNEAVEKERDLGYWEPPHYARPVYETLAKVHMGAKNYAAAEDAWRSALSLRPGSGHALLGLARTQALADKAAEAKKTFAQAARAWQDADRDLPQLQEALRAARE